MSRGQIVVLQARLEQLAFWRNPESAFFTIALPLGLLVIFGATSGSEAVPGRSDVTAITFLVPRMLAFGIILAAYATPAGTVAVLRSDGVLKRLRATPLSPAAYIAGQLASIFVTCTIIAITIVGLGAVAHGTLPPGPRAAVVIALALVLGIGCFAALGLALSAFIPDGTAAGVITNGTYIPLALVSGTFDASLQLPAWLDAIVAALPVKALTDALRVGYDPAELAWPIGQLVVLASWLVIGVGLAVRYFRWEPR